MEVIVVLLALAATATAQQNLHAEARLFNENTGQLIGTVFFRQNGQSGHIEIEHEAVLLPPGIFAVAVSPERYVGAPLAEWPEILPDSLIEFFVLNVTSESTRTVNRVNDQLTLTTDTQTLERTAIVDHALVLRTLDAQSKATTFLARGIVRRKAFVRIFSTHKPNDIYGSMIFHQYKDGIQITVDIPNLPSGNYSIMMHEKDDNGSYKLSPRLTKLSSMTVDDPHYLANRLDVDKSLGIHSLDDISGRINIHKDSGEVVASSEVE